jgi:hypothetical protein
VRKRCTCEIDANYAGKQWKTWNSSGNPVLV